MNRHTIRNILLTLLLAVLCVAGSMLMASRYFAPEFYGRVTAPVRAGLAWTADLGRSALDHASSMVKQASDFLDQVFSAPSEDDAQVASGPSVDDVFISVSDPSITSLTVVGGQEILTGGIMPVVYFNQSDPAWADQPYGTDHIGGYGCGPTALAMAIASLTGADSNPATVAQWAFQNHQWSKGKGSALSIVRKCAADYGLTVQSLPELSVDAIEDALLSGKLLVALMGPGHFTSGGHFILLRGVTLTGSVLVADPNSLEHSLTEWDAQLLLSELSRSRAGGAPLWALSVE